MGKLNKVELYNTLSRREEEFRVLEPGYVKMYSCGPTVYDNAHIGNLATFIRDDLLKRTLRAAGYKVRHAMNLTDVDDKTIRDSKKEEFFKEGDEMQSLLNLTAKFERVFKEDIKRVGNDVDSIQFIKATETIAEMVDLVNKLLKNGIAYKSEDGIYFSISKYLKSGKEYGLLQKLNLSQGRSRINNDEYEKDSAADFVLWKAKSEGEPFWEAEFEDQDGLKFSMPGRPGWHLECSAMSEKLLGVPFDIHTGGVDLKFPHHENEIAQSCGALGTETFANTFVHMSHILVDGRKMSKSLNNFYTLRDIEERGFDPMAFRLLVLSGHYRSEINFTWEILEAAQNRLHRWRAAFDMRWQEYLAKDSAIIGYEIIDKIQEELEDDLNTPGAIAQIDAAVKTIESGSICGRCIEELGEGIRDLLGVDLLGADVTPEQAKLLGQRIDAKEAKDFAKSDRLRDELKKQGIELRDDARGQIWRRM